MKQENSAAGVIASDECRQCDGTNSVCRTGWKLCEHNPANAHGVTPTDGGKTE